MFSRRQFIGVLGALGALPASLRALGGRLTMARQRALPSQAAVRALGIALLPGEMGTARAEIASDAFWRWMTGYRAGAELLHPYGSPRVSVTGPSPVPKWTLQLEALDRTARETHKVGFAALSVNDRQSLVREALSDVKSERLPAVAEAPHIALGLLAHFYGSSAASDLCYQARIGRNTCRPLVQNGRKPLPLAESRS